MGFPHPDIRHGNPCDCVVQRVGLNCSREMCRAGWHEGPVRLEGISWICDACDKNVVSEVSAEVSAACLCKRAKDGGIYPTGACPVHGASHGGGMAGHDHDDGPVVLALDAIDITVDIMTQGIPGAGGVSKITLVHRPTGVRVTSDECTSQHAARVQAMARLRDALAPHGVK